MMKIIIITPTRKSRTVKTHTMAAAQMSAADGPATATKAPHPSAIAMAAATASHCSGVRPRTAGTGFGIAAIALASRRAREARGGRGGNGAQELRDEALLPGVRCRRIRGNARDAHQHPVGNDALHSR